MSAAASDDSAATFGGAAAAKEEDEEMAVHDTLIVRAEVCRPRSTSAPWHGHAGALTVAKDGPGPAAGAVSAGGIASSCMYVRSYIPSPHTSQNE